MPEIKQHEYDLLNEIAQNPMVTQANLSNRLGIAVGSVNWYIKRLIHRGWIKVSHLDRTRLKYDLTPEGVLIFSQRAMSYARDSLKVYSSFRNKAKAVVNELKRQGIQKVNLQGDSEMMDIMQLTCIEVGLTVSETPVDVVIREDGPGYKIVQCEPVDAAK